MHVNLADVGGAYRTKAPAMGLLDPSPGEVSFAAINQRVRLAMNNTHASQQRFLKEGRRNRQRIEPLLDFLIYSQRLIDVLVTLQNHPRQRQLPPFCRAVSGRLRSGDRQADRPVAGRHGAVGRLQQAQAQL